MRWLDCHSYRNSAGESTHIKINILKKCYFYLVKMAAEQENLLIFLNINKYLVFDKCMYNLLVNFGNMFVYSYTLKRGQGICEFI